MAHVVVGLATTTIISLLFFISLSQSAPTRPNIPTSYFTKVSVQIREGDRDYWKGGGHYALDIPQGRAREDIRLDGNRGFISFHVLDRYDLNATYIIEDDKCTKKEVTGSIPSPWAWVSKASYTSNSSFQGKVLFNWEYTDASKTTFKVSVDSENPNVPVFYSSRLANGSSVAEVDIVYLEFNASTPEEWVFYVPQICESTEGGIDQLGGDPGSVAYFANANWDCADVACSQRVPAGTGQPSYGCAEFAARSLAAGGYFSGLSSTAPQSSYYNWNGYDLCYTTSLAKALSSIGFRDYGTNPGSVGAAVAVFGNGGDGSWSHACIGVGSNSVDCHNNARYQMGASWVMFQGIDALYGP